MSKNISKNVSSKCNQKLFDHAEQSATDAHEASLKGATQKEEEETKLLIKLPVLKTLPKNNSETNEGKMIAERYISSDQN